MKQKLRLFSLAATLGLAANVQAHTIWIEPNTEQAVSIQFGHYGINVRESSPGGLDNFVKLTATQVSPKGDKALAATTTASGITLPVKPAKGESIVAEDREFALRKTQREGKDVAMWYRPAARYIVDSTNQAPKLDLDIVPTGTEGQFNVTLKGQPITTVDVKVFAPSGWVKEVRTDAQGQVNFDLPWQGQYVMELTHIDRTSGERPVANGAEKYDEIFYSTTLGFVKTDGIPAGKSDK